MIVYHSAMLARIKALRTRPFVVALLVALAAQTLFTVDIQRPSKIMFDEVHYVPAARTLLALEGPRNVEHPMLGKELIAVGIAVLGDNPIGWRITPALAGTATVVAVFAILWLLLGSIRPALIGAALAMFNQSIFVQARTAMLDIFLGAFLLWGIFFMLWAMRAQGRKVWLRWIAAAIFFGLAVGVKWAAIPYVAMACVAFLGIRWWDAVRRQQPARHALTGRDQHYWPGLPAIPALLVFGTVSIAMYLATFSPAFFYQNAPLNFSGLLNQQLEMYALQTQVLSAHTYQSDWWSWPLMLRPIWYFYEMDAGAQRGVLLIGNPVVMWGGLIGVLACYWAYWRDGSKKALGVALLWTASVAIYALIPKSLGFYYYYHLSGIFLCLVLAVAMHHFDRGRNRGWDEWCAAAALVLFIYFYPILSAAPLNGPQGFRHWMWFPGWA